MSIPDYQTLMLPVLSLLSHGQVRPVVPDVTDPVGDQFDLTADERDQMLPSGLQATFVNRTHWAVTYMYKAGLLARPIRGRVAITDLGRAALAKKPAKIDIAFLMQYPDFEAFRTKAKSKMRARPKYWYPQPRSRTRRSCCLGRTTPSARLSRRTYSIASSRPTTDGRTSSGSSSSYSAPWATERRPTRPGSRLRS